MFEFFQGLWHLLQSLANVPGLLHALRVHFASVCELPPEVISLTVILATCHSWRHGGSVSTVVYIVLCSVLTVRCHASYLENKAVFWDMWHASPLFVCLLGAVSFSLLFGWGMRRALTPSGVAFVLLNDLAVFAAFCGQSGVFTSLCLEWVIRSVTPETVLYYYHWRNVRVAVVSLVGLLWLIMLGPFGQWRKLGLAGTTTVVTLTDGAEDRPRLPRLFWWISITLPLVLVYVGASAIYADNADVDALVKIQQSVRKNLFITPPPSA